MTNDAIIHILKLKSADYLFKKKGKKKKRKEKKVVVTNPSLSVEQWLAMINANVRISYSGKLGTLPYQLITFIES
jgi:hypothetical protein